jgi:hypothetical protein
MISASDMRDLREYGTIRRRRGGNASPESFGAIISLGAQVIISSALEQSKLPNLILTWMPTLPPSV